MSCNIFKKSLSSDISNINSISFNINWLSGLIPAYDANLSGIWQPVWVSDTRSQTSGVELLYPARNKASRSFSPCNCQDSQINPDALYQEESSLGLCSYCGNPPTGTKWRLYDNNSNASPRQYDTSCCSGGCDTMLKVDDYIPKIPYLNYAYITGLADWKHKLQFPACNNKSLGCESFAEALTLRTINGVSLRVDWRIQETISEVPYNLLTSQHDTKHMHEISYDKSKKISSTCGNFIMTSMPSDAISGNFYSNNYPILTGLISTTIVGETPNKNIPSITEFTKLPYGFDQETYKNIFINNQKLGSYWKWNYSSGILCWYRYYNTGIPNDARPLPGVDLYISPGDFFYAKNDGPEPATDLNNPTGMVGSIQSCPSGLKILQGSELTCIIPSGSQFAYISANIYERFHNLYYKLLEILPTGNDIAKRSFETAAILSTAPRYDEIIVDLLKRNNTFDYGINNYGQIDLLNKYMQSGTDFDSVSRLNYISNSQELFDTLVNKYGAYLWVPPNSSKNITFASSVNSSFAVDMNFNLSLQTSDTLFSSATCRPMTNCNSRSINKNFSYAQNIGYSLGKVYTATNENARYATSCVSGNITPNNFGLYSNIYYNESKIKSVFTSNGCSVLSGIYPRISESNNTKFCRDCDPYSSFYLIPNAETTECGNYNAANSFCYATLARRFNNSPPQFSGDQQNRLERSISDGTKRFVRSYPALFFNPYIDSVAFHQNNGVFINSPPFKLDAFAAFEFNTTSAGSASNIYIQFDTNNVGIKIYNISAEYLQTSSSSTYSCKRFPVSGTCKCLPIISVDTISRPTDCDNPNPNQISSSNIFTPGLSTRYSPRLKQYGGFSQDYLNSIFGSGIVIGGGIIPVLSSYTNPRTPFGCNSTASITLHNYTNTIWNLSVQGKNPNADLYVTVNEDVDLSGPRYNFVIYQVGGGDGQITDYYTMYQPIIKSKRFATKVTINSSTVLYGGQTAPITDGATSFTVQLQNPFLAAAMSARGGNAESVLYPPSGNLQNTYIFSNNGITKIGDPQRGDETTAVTLNFTQKFNSHKLLFKIPPLQPMGTLTEGFFDPNKGLIGSANGKSPISGNILYTNELTNADFPTGKVFYGNINNRVINVINSLNEFDYHKKLRLYIQSNNKWYKYTGSNIGCFLVNNIKYPGSPSFFEYNTEINTKNLPGLLLTPVRKHINFSFIKNSNWNNSFPLYDEQTPFPFSKNICKVDPSSDYEIRIPGIRAYFLIPEQDPAIQTNLASMDDISLFVAPSNFSYGTTIVFNDNTHWICIKPTQPTLRSSYIYSEFSYLDHYFSDTHIAFDKINRQGYVYNTKKSCSYPITLYSDTTLISSSNTILEKSIYVSYKNKNGSQVKNFNTDDVYMQPYTLFKLQNSVPQNVRVYNIFPTTGTSLVLGQISAPIAENNPLLNNSYIPGKWGDVINYNGRLVDAIVDAQYPIEDIYPKSTYNNLFQQMIINNHSKKHIYKITDAANTVSLVTGTRDNGPENIYYSILHKYGIGDNSKTYTIDSDKYHNFIPLIDLNLLNISVPTDPSLPNSGTINVSNVTYTSKPDEGYEPYGDGKFWIDFPSGASMEGTFVPASDFYTETLRIDQPTFWLNSTTQSTRELTPNVTYRRRFSPNNITNYNASSSAAVFDNSSSYVMTNVNRRQPFWVYPIYGDRDDGTCDNTGCFGSNDHGLAKAANLELKANYRIASNSTQTIGGGSINYALAYDAGIYNIIGNDSLVEIKRFSLTTNNSIDNVSDSCSSAFILPSNYRLNSSSPVFQSTILDTNVSTPLSYPIDSVANEMLFRILYGQAQYVNKQMYFIDNLIYNKQDIINYTDPRITAEDIYSQILYNYDKAATSNFNLNGSFTINGVASIGSTTTLSIDDLTITIVIENRSGNIYAVATSSISIPYFGNKLEVLLYSGVTTSSSYVILNVAPDADPPPPAPPDNNTSIVYQGECLYYDSYQYYQLAFAYESSNPPNLQNIVSSSTSCGIGWGNAYGEAGAGQPGDCCCGPAGPCGGGCVALSVTSWGPNHLRQCVCGQPQVGSVGFMAPFTTQRTPPCNGLGYSYGIGSGPCTSFDVGYCRKNNCQTCDETLQEETSVNFEYDWQYCRTNFNLFGHIYRQVHQFDGSPIIVQPRPPDCYTNFFDTGYDQCGNVEPGTTVVRTETANCTTYPVMGLTRDQLDNLRKNNMLLGVTQAVGYVCSDQTNGYVPPTPTTVCIPVAGAGGECQDGYKGCVFIGCPTPFSSFNSSGGCSTGDCDFCYTPESSYTAPCDDIDSGFEYPSGKCDEYCHFCGVGRTGSHNILSKNRLYLSTTTTTNSPYNPLCASSLCTISYSSSAITLTIGGKSMCFSRTLLRCPRISINSTMSQLSLIDNIESSCDQCLSSALKVFVPEQRQAFVTKTESRRCLLATFTSCSVNNPGVVGGGWQSFYNHASWAHQCGGGEVEYGCGQLGSLMYGNDDLLFNVVYECLKGLSCSMSSTIAGYEVPETQWRLANQMRSRYQYLAKGSSHIPTEDIIEGVIPGSVSDVITESFNSGGASITRTGNIVNDVSTTHAFYFTYSYIRPVTIQDIMRNDNNIICTADNLYVSSNNTSHHCSNVPFPSAYASNLAPYQAYLFTVNRTGNIEGASYTHTHPTYYQASNCDGGISCYYRHKVFICGSADFCCMSDLGVTRNEGIDLSCSTINAPFSS